VTTTDSEPHASTSKTLVCPQPGCTFAARKQKALDRHTARTHASFRNTALELLTGHNYAAPAVPTLDDEDTDGPPSKRRKLDRKYACPLKASSGCAFLFKRVYDVERHLDSFHQTSMSRADLAMLYH
jgi:uncharacterized C2H2 Zn-finger protein